MLALRDVQLHKLDIVIPSPNSFLPLTFSTVQYSTVQYSTVQYSTSLEAVNFVVYTTIIQIMLPDYAHDNYYIISKRNLVSTQNVSD